MSSMTCFQNLFSSWTLSQRACRCLHPKSQPFAFAAAPGPWETSQLTQSCLCLFKLSEPRMVENCKAVRNKVKPELIKPNGGNPHIDFTILHDSAESGTQWRTGTLTFSLDTRGCILVHMCACDPPVSNALNKSELCNMHHMPLYAICMTSGATCTSASAERQAKAARPWTKFRLQFDGNWMKKKSCFVQKQKAH